MLIFVNIVFNWLHHPVFKKKFNDVFEMIDCNICQNFLRKRKKYSSVLCNKINVKCLEIGRINIRVKKTNILKIKIFDEK